MGKCIKLIFNGNVNFQLNKIFTKKNPLSDGGLAFPMQSQLFSI